MAFLWSCNKISFSSLSSSLHLILSNFSCSLLLFINVFLLRSTLFLFPTLIDFFYLRYGFRCIFCSHILFSFFYHLLISIFLLCRRCVGSIFLITFINKKQVTTSLIFSFFNHIPRTSFFLYHECFSSQIYFFFVSEIGWIDFFTSDCFLS